MYYQTLPFTCGPACLLSAIQKSQNKNVSIIDEIEIWKESNTIFMGEGHPGTCPYGLAVAAHKRGFFTTKVAISESTSIFTKSINDPDKQIIINLAQNSMLSKAARAGIQIERICPVDFRFVANQINSGFYGILLVSDEDGPHWILVHGIQKLEGLTDPVLQIFDPWRERGENVMYRSEFERVASWEGFSCCVFVGPIVNK